MHKSLRLAIPPLFVLLSVYSLSAQTITTSPKAELYSIESRNIPQVINDYSHHLRNVVVIGDKPQKIKKPTELKVCALTNLDKSFHYQLYIVEYNGEYKAILPLFVQDNNYLDSENKKLDEKLAKLTDAVEQEKQRVQYEKDCYNKTIDSLRNVIQDSLNFYRKLSSQAQPYREEYESRLKEAESFVRDSINKPHQKWFNSLPASSRNAINSLFLSTVLLSESNSVGGHDAIIHYFNRATKTIKYFDWTGKVKNAVDDYVANEINGKYSFSGRDTGPYATGEQGGGTWENVLYNWSAKTLVLTSITITYMDGTKLIMSGKDINAVIRHAEWQLTDKNPLISSIVFYKGLDIDKDINAKFERESGIVGLNISQIDVEIARWKRLSENIDSNVFDNAFFSPLLKYRNNKSDLSSKERVLEQYKISNYLQ